MRVERNTQLPDNNNNNNVGAARPRHVTPSMAGGHARNGLTAFDVAMGMATQDVFAITSHVASLIAAQTRDTRHLGRIYSMARNFIELMDHTHPGRAYLRAAQRLREILNTPGSPSHAYLIRRGEERVWETIDNVHETPLVDALSSAYT